MRSPSSRRPSGGRRRATGEDRTTRAGARGAQRERTGSASCAPCSRGRRLPRLEQVFRLRAWLGSAFPPMRAATPGRRTRLDSGLPDRSPALERVCRPSWRRPAQAIRRGLRRAASPRDCVRERSAPVTAARPRWNLTTFPLDRAPRRAPPRVAAGPVRQQTTRRTQAEATYGVPVGVSTGRRRSRRDGASADRTSALTAWRLAR